MKVVIYTNNKLYMIPQIIGTVLISSILFANMNILWYGIVGTILYKEVRNFNWTVPHIASLLRLFLITIVLTTDICGDYHNRIMAYLSILLFNLIYNNDVNEITLCVSVVTIVFLTSYKFIESINNRDTNIPGLIIEDNSRYLRSNINATFI